MDNDDEVVREFVLSRVGTPGHEYRGNFAATRSSMPRVGQHLQLPRWRRALQPLAPVTPDLLVALPKADPVRSLDAPNVTAPLDYARKDHVGGPSSDSAPPPMRTFKTCAVVGSSGLLLAREAGPEVDAHDAVIRFNRAPALGFEAFVGRRTTLRLVNRQHFGFRCALLDTAPPCPSPADVALHALNRCGLHAQSSMLPCQQHSATRHVTMFSLSPTVVAV